MMGEASKRHSPPTRTTVSGIGLALEWSTTRSGHSSTRAMPIPSYCWTSSLATSGGYAPCHNRAPSGWSRISRRMSSSRPRRLATRKANSPSSGNRSPTRTPEAAQHVAHRPRRTASVTSRRRDPPRSGAAEWFGNTHCRRLLLLTDYDQRGRKMESGVRPPDSPFWHFPGYARECAHLVHRQFNGLSDVSLLKLSDLRVGQGPCLLTRLQFVKFKSVASQLDRRPRGADEAQIDWGRQPFVADVGYGQEVSASVLL